MGMSLDRWVAVVGCVALAGGCTDSGPGDTVDAATVVVDPEPVPLEPLAWPLAMDLGMAVTRLVQPSAMHCAAMGRDHLAWSAVTTPDAGFQQRVGLDHQLATVDMIDPSTCSLGVTAAGTVVYATRYLGMDVWSGFGEVGTGRGVLVPHARAVLAADPGGGMLVLTEDEGFPRQILRLTAELAVDTGFAPITAEAPVGVRVVQTLPGGGVALTVQIGAVLRRFDARTGAAIAAFAPVDVTPTPETMRQLAALPDGGVALIGRRDPGTLTIDRFDATGARAPRINRSLGPLGLFPRMVVDGSGGKLVAEVAQHGFLRLDPATGELDRGFGVGGLWWDVPLPVLPCSAWWIIWGYRADLAGATADGTLMFTGDTQCAADSPHYAIMATMRTQPAP